MNKYLVSYIDSTGMYRNITINAEKLSDLKSQFECAVFEGVVIYSIEIL